MVIAGEEFSVVIGSVKMKPKTETFQKLGGEIGRENHVCIKFNGWMF